MLTKRNRNKTILLVLAAFAFVFSAAQPPLRVLVFSKTEGGYRHASIAAGKQMFLQLAKRHRFQVDTTEDASHFTEAALKRYNVIVFLSTRDNVLDTFQQKAFQQYIRKGGGFLGIHAATTTEYTWPWYNQLIGAYFDGHPEPQAAFYRKIDRAFYATRSFPDTLTWTDEIYNFRSVQDSLHYVITVDEQSYRGGKMGGVHPVSWYHTFEGGRVFYLGLGHFDAPYRQPIFVRTILDALRWCARKEEPTTGRWALHTKRR